MFCKFCGKQVNDGAAFCSGCGKNIGAAPGAAVPPASYAAPPVPPVPQPPMYGGQPPRYSAPGYRYAGSSSGNKAAGWIEAAIIAIISIIFMIGQFSFNMIKFKYHHTTEKYSFGYIAFKAEGVTEDAMTLIICILSILCIMTSVAFLIVALVRAKNHPASCCKFAAASLLPTIAARIGLIIEVVYLKSDLFSDYYHLSGSVIFSIIFCLLLYIAAIVVTDSITE